MDTFTIIFLVVALALVYIHAFIKKHKQNNTITKTGTINQESYQRYAKFYDNIVPQDAEFETKMNKIYNLIEVDKKTDIKEIAQKVGCTYEECILKINYLKNKRQLGTYHVDHKRGKILPCTQEEYQLIEKYKPYIYYNHLSIEEIANRMPGVTRENLAETKEEIYKEIYDLYDSNLLNGIKINEIDKEIIYYTVEKRKKEKDFITIRCENCGALNDVNRGSKVRCQYCDTIVEDKTVEEVQIIK